MWKGFPHDTSLSAHIRAMEPMLLVMVIKVALARSSLLTESRFSLLIMFPKLEKTILGVKSPSESQEKTGIAYLTKVLISNCKKHCSG